MKIILTASHLLLTTCVNAQVEHFMAEDYQVDWHQVNHEQLVYCKRDVMLNGKSAVDYKWSVLATNPDATDAGWLERQHMLRSLKMQVPTKEDLARPDRRVLDAYLANGLGIELHEAQTAFDLVAKVDRNALGAVTLGTVLGLDASDPCASASVAAVLLDGAVSHRVREALLGST